MNQHFIIYITSCTNLNSWLLTIGYSSFVIHVDPRPLIKGEVRFKYSYLASYIRAKISPQYAWVGLRALGFVWLNGSVWTHLISTGSMFYADTLCIKDNYIIYIIQLLLCRLPALVIVERDSPWLLHWLHLRQALYGYWAHQWLCKGGMQSYLSNVISQVAMTILLRLSYFWFRLLLWVFCP